MVKLAIIAPHPVQYHAPLFKELEKLYDIETIVLYCENIGLEPIYVEELKKTIKWDIPLLDGYKYKFLKNYSRKAVNGFFSRINPSLFTIFFKNKYDVILISGYDNLSCWFALVAAKLMGTKIIWRGEATLRKDKKPSSLKKWLKKLILLRFFRACDAVMYSCTGNKDYLKFYGVPDRKLFSIPCAVDNDFFRSEREKYLGEKKKIRKELGVSKGDFVVLFSARFTSRKRPMDLLKSIKLARCEDISLLFVGDGPEKINMEKFTQEFDIKAKFTGFVNQSEISKYYSISDIAVVISDYDPSPKAMNETMNFELPIIVTNVVGTAQDLIINNVNGFIVNVGDVNEIAKKIEYLSRNRATTKVMGENSWQIVKKWNFSEDAKGIEKAIRYVKKDD